MIKLDAKDWAKRGYSLFEDGRLNIIGVRNHPFRPNTFNDRLILAVYNEATNWLTREYQITTLPGSYWLTTLLNPKGTAMLKAGQYVNAFALGEHKGQPALVQVKPVTVYRDRNQDLNYDFEQEEIGMFGINFHKAGTYSHFVNSWSAGCQVFQKSSDFFDFLHYCNLYKTKNGGFFTYTLFNEDLRDD